jgi:hypothetical protein
MLIAAGPERIAERVNITSPCGTLVLPLYTSDTNILSETHFRIT